ncbi:RNA-binding domain-containing protein [Ascobolus immersus RN42]|uniref:RNA-binding domain-containing protein n=1 Tax=Ascobolus immersus RN42 TaxID=1160509 RepID=A0A3N4INW6_ASCIM|nr:RNA-binding domain-containing protein [Ascobolus immersus RN42]
MSKPGHHWDQDKEATVYVGNLDERVTDALVWELMLQAGRIVNVYLPKDRVTQVHQGFGFVEFKSEDDAEYAARIMNQVRLFGKPIRVNKASADKQKTAEIGAELHVRNLDPMVDEKTLYDTFSTFGNLIQIPKIARNEDGSSKCYGFISYDAFESADKAIDSMNGQYLMNKQIHVEYAFKKDGKNERHGDAAERLLAAQARKHNVQIAGSAIPPTIFGAPTGPAAGMGGPMPGMAPMGMGAVPPMAPRSMMQQQPPVPTGPYGGGYQQPPQQMGYAQQPQYPPRGPSGIPTGPAGAPPQGLPTRPPPSRPAGYPPPQQYSQPPPMPPGFVPTGPAAGNLPARPPAPYGAPPPPAGFGGPGGPPPGFGPGPGRGAPPPPPGFNNFASRR